MKMKISTTLTMRLKIKNKDFVIKKNLRNFHLKKSLKKLQMKTNKKQSLPEIIYKMTIL